MKKYFYTPVLVALLTAFTMVRAQGRQEYLGLPGDNLNLFAVMKLFQESETLEGFERSLNDQNNYINNLDLNGDGYVDYIRVIDNVERNVHFIVLQVAINPRETQDVAVFTVVKEPNGAVTMQLVGDEALYGRDYIIEPIYDETPNPGYTGRVNNQRVKVVRTTTYEVAAWPVIRFIFMPTYVVWRSPWYWNYYPTYWRPWSPFYWHHYHGYHYNYYSWYYGHYRHWDHHRHNYWKDVYHVHHYHYSPSVRSRINDGYYKKTYSKPESRNEGVALYQRTRSAGGGPSGTVSTGARRGASGTSVSQTSRTTRTREVSTSGTSNTRQTARSGSTTNRQSSGNEVKRSGDSRSTPAQSTRQSTTVTRTQTKSTTTTTTTSRQSNTRNQPEARSSERRTAPASNSSGSSGQSVSKSKSQSSGSSASRRSSGSSSSGSSKSSDSKSSEKSTRSSGRR